MKRHFILVLIAILVVSIILGTSCSDTAPSSTPNSADKIAELETQIIRLTEQVNSLSAEVGGLSAEVTSPKLQKVGSYTGDGTENRQVAVGFPCKFVFIQEDISPSQSPDCWLTTNTHNSLYIEAGREVYLRSDPGKVRSTSYVRLHPDDGFIVYQYDGKGTVVYDENGKTVLKPSYPEGANIKGWTYRYFAVG